MRDISFYKQNFDDFLAQKNLYKEPVALYEPIQYILSLGGKRLRPVLTLLSCDLFGGNFINARDAALAIEMFHNFSLIHDDIMDAAPIRRGKKTVHEKWDINTGILSGDAMLVMAVQLLEAYEGELYKKLTNLFNKTALEVCEGQQYDFDFESRTDVTVKEYITMISLKTSVLIAAALKFGAMIASAPGIDAEMIYQYGINLGIAFQLQDDYLDVFGGAEFGKQKAGDIVENKKTFLLLKTMELADQRDREQLSRLYQSKIEPDVKIKEVLKLFEKYKVRSVVDHEIRTYTDKAIACVGKLDLSEGKKQVLIGFADELMKRKV
ncbi:MAG: polyprenyl synthetase family protein [Flavobacteriaceae bacterium]|nr:polyprenyl synthetase family protein [Flavobacteriaceae bacterium]